MQHREGEQIELAVPSHVLDFLKLGSVHSNSATLKEDSVQGRSNLQRAIMGQDRVVAHVSIKKGVRRAGSGGMLLLVSVVKSQKQKHNRS